MLQTRRLLKLLYSIESLAADIRRQLPRRILLYRVKFQFTHLQRDLHRRSSHLLGPLLLAIHGIFAVVLRAAKSTTNDFNWRRFHLCSQSSYTDSTRFSFYAATCEFSYPDRYVLSKDASASVIGLLDCFDQAIISN